MPAEPFVELSNSTYLDLTSYQGNGSLPIGSPLAAPFTINVALVLERANAPPPTFSTPTGPRARSRSRH